jgi:hypothetical protein
MTIGKDFKRNGRGLIEALFQHLSGRTEGNYEASVRLASVPSEIRTMDFPNTTSPAHSVLLTMMIMMMMMMMMLMMMRDWYGRIEGIRLAEEKVNSLPREIFALMSIHPSKIAHGLPWIERGSPR